MIRRLFRETEWNSHRRAVARVRSTRDILKTPIERFKLEEMRSAEKSLTAREKRLIKLDMEIESLKDNVRENELEYEALLEKKRAATRFMAT